MCNPPSQLSTLSVSISDTKIDCLGSKIASQRSACFTRNERRQPQRPESGAQWNKNWGLVVVVEKKEATELHPGSKHGHELQLATSVTRTVTLGLTTISHGHSLQTMRKGTTLERNGMACAAASQKMSSMKLIRPY